MRHLPLVALAVLSGVPAGASGVARPVRAPNAPVVRISAEIVQLDVVVTDKKGHHVTDLAPEDFVIREDGQPQKITRFSHVQVGAPQPPPRQEPARSAESLAPPAANGMPQAQERTIVLLVDDFSLSPHSFVRTRRALGRAIDALQATDRVAIVTASRGGRALEPTTDREANRAAVAAVRRTPWTREELTRLGSASATFSYLSGVSRYDGGTFGDWNARMVLQSLAVVKETIRSMQALPGRKALLVLSEGFSGLTSLGGSLVHEMYWPLDRLYGDADDVLGAWKRLGDFAARAGVVVYAVDPRGLATGGLNAEHSVPDALQPGRLAEHRLSQLIVLHHSQATLELLPDQTGGLTLLDRNDLSGALYAVLDDLSGYYLIGYPPGETTFNGAGFRDIEVTVTRPGLKVRTRKGFFAVTDAQVAASLE
jgi:VWFA-related protein